MLQLQNRRPSKMEMEEERQYPAPAFDLDASDFYPIGGVVAIVSYILYMCQF